MNLLNHAYPKILVLFLAGLLGLAGCSGLDLHPKTPPDELLRDAFAYIKAENFEDAKIALNKILEDYPDSPERVTASLLKAEVAYKAEQYEESKFLFKSFLEQYPVHRLADRAHYYMAMSDYQLIDIETRDQTSAQNALEGFDSFLKTYPDSKYRKKALQKRMKCLESLARNQLEIGRYYFRISSFQSAIIRFRQLMAAYPNQPFLDEVMFLLAESYYNEQNFDEARQRYLELIEKFPRSEFAKEARVRLRSMNPFPDRSESDDDKS